MLASIDEADAETEADALAAIQAAEIDRRLRFPDAFNARRAAYLDGFSLHAGVRIHENDRDGLEHLCRYALRPPFALKRLSTAPEGRLAYRMKRPRGGSLWLLLTPDELMARLATLVPPPRVHAVRYHGVFAPNAKVRRQVAEAARGGSTAARLAGHGPITDARAGSVRPGPFTAALPCFRVPWAEILKKVFVVDALGCPDCGGAMKLIALIAEETTARRILEHLGLDAAPPPLARAQAPPEHFDSGPDYDVPDPAP